MMKFEWDTGKAAANLRKHGVSFDEAGTVFLDQLALSGPEPDHPVGEPHYITFEYPAWDGCLRSSTPIAPGSSALSAHAVSPVQKGKIGLRHHVMRPNVIRRSHVMPCNAIFIDSPPDIRRAPVCLQFITLYQQLNAIIIGMHKLRAVQANFFSG